MKCVRCQTPLRCAYYEWMTYSQETSRLFESMNTQSWVTLVRQYAWVSCWLIYAVWVYLYEHDSQIEKNIITNRSSNRMQLRSLLSESGETYHSEPDVRLHYLIPLILQQKCIRHQWSSLNDMTAVILAFSR